MVTIVSISPSITISEDAVPRVMHSSIYIDGDGDFTAANGVTGGNGTASDPYLIEGWYIDAGNGVYCIQILNTRAHFIIRDVYARWTHMTATCIKLDNVFNGTIDNSTVELTGRAILVLSSNNITISETFITGSWEGALGIWNSANVTVSGIRIDQNRLANLYCSSSSNITIRDNDISGSGSSITVYESSNVTIASNTLTDTTVSIHIVDSHNATVVDNIIFVNAQSAEIRNSYNISVYHNYFVDYRLFPVSDDLGPENAWDDGYPSGGNYWSDYTGVDNCSGTNQDICPDPDGIGDTPFIIDADSRDRYPLMSAPGSSRPRPPTDVYASLSGTSLEDVTVTWTLSPDDGTGFRTTVGYKILRNTTYVFNGSGYGLVGFVPNGTFEFIDDSVGEGNPNNYYYLVCAVDAYNNSTCSDNQAGKYTRLLSRGLDIISVPLVQSDEDIETVLQTVEYDQVWTYDSLGMKWRSHTSSKPYGGELKTISHRIGVWINVVIDCNLTVAGAVPTETAIELKAGWNLMGFPSFNGSFGVGELKNETGSTRVEGLDISSPPYFLREMNDGDILQSGHGYWVYVTADFNWTVGN